VEGRILLEELSWVIFSRRLELFVTKSQFAPAAVIKFIPLLIKAPSLQSKEASLNSAFRNSPTNKCIILFLGVIIRAIGREVHSNGRASKCYVLRKMIAHSRNLSSESPLADRALLTHAREIRLNFFEQNSVLISNKYNV